MGIARSRMKKVAPVSVTEETVCSGGSDIDGHLLGPSNTSLVRIVSIRERDRTDCNSEGQESEVSAEDDTLAEVDRILAECENIDNSRTSHKMPTLGSKSSGICYAKRHDASNDIYRDSKHELQHGTCVKNDEVNTINKPTSNIQEQISPSKDLLCSTNTESTATALCHGTGGISSLSLPITYDPSEEDLMDTIEREFG
ncbi:hypothetical protein IRJ41_022076 [Triplophysa rosa]|uniref:Uncharacterized protein n=1 Tax=Triplophysa rosa TaxID=992332 RepID=A0A9W7WLN9_TRIRA|nr:hypothetical protein IRJ41_022076 [Triplophysa rosa]